MTTRKLDKAKWGETFDRLSKMLGPKQVEIEVAGLALGDQIEAKWLPLIGIVYDPKDDIIEVALEELDHIVHKPREVFVAEEEAGALTALEIVDVEGIKQIVRLRDPLTLPPPPRS
jgi:hypothetical protein